MDEFQHIPPAIRLLMEEDWGQVDSLEDFISKYRRISKEIATQAEWTYENFDYYDKESVHPGSFVITASGGLNPFSEHDTCSEPSCRVHSARQIASTLGLYADVVAIPDTLSYALANMPEPTIDQMRWVLTEMLVLKELYPLMKAGVIRFWSGSLGLCSSCHDNLENKIREGAIAVATEIEEYIHAEIYDDEIIIGTTGIMESPFTYEIKLTQADKNKLKSGVPLDSFAKDCYAEVIEDRVRSTLFDMRFSERTSSMLFSTSRRELYALRSYDNAAPALSNLAVWEKARSVQLPWVNKMSAQQVVELRDAASKALPSFRETFVRHIATPDASTESVATKINELRAEASAVERELSALNPSGEENFRNVAGSLGITVSVYGFASGFAPPAIALGGLMSLLGLLHSSARHDKQEQERLITQPAYVLLKAKELAEHAPNGSA